MAPQVSILGRLLFDIFLNEIFMFIWKCNLCNYADDNTFYSTGKNLNRIRRNLETDFMILHQWFHENHMTLNPGKFHYMIISSRDLSHCHVTLNNALNNIHERALRLIYNYHKKSFNSVLAEINLRTIHQKKLEFLAIEIYKFQNGLSPPIMNDVFFSRQNICNLRKFQELSTSTKNTVNFSMENISYRGPQLWNVIPNNIKLEPTLELFRKKITKWICGPCPCRMCKNLSKQPNFYYLLFLHSW